MFSPNWATGFHITCKISFRAALPVRNEDRTPPYLAISVGKVVVAARPTSRWRKSKLASKITITVTKLTKGTVNLPGLLALVCRFYRRVA